MWLSSEPLVSPKTFRIASKQFITVSRGASRLSARFIRLLRAYQELRRAKISKNTENKNKKFQMIIGINFAIFRLRNITTFHYDLRIQLLQRKIQSTFCITIRNLFENLAHISSSRYSCNFYIDFNW